MSIQVLRKVCVCLGLLAIGALSGCCHHRQCCDDGPACCGPMDGSMSAPMPGNAPAEPYDSEPAPPMPTEEAPAASANYEETPPVKSDAGDVPSAPPHVLPISIGQEPQFIEVEQELPTE